MICVPWEHVPPKHISQTDIPRVSSFPCENISDTIVSILEGDQYKVLLNYTMSNTKKE